MFVARRVTVRVAGLGVAALVAASTVVVATANLATAAACPVGSIVVSNNLDGAGPPPGSLRAAFATADAAAGPQTVCVDPSVVGPITLVAAGGGDLVYNAATSPDLTVLGNGITIHAAPTARVIDNQTTGPLRLDSVAITGGTPTTAGGGIMTIGPLTLTGSTVANNTSGDRGGGVNAVNDVTIVNSTISTNVSGFDGGGICAGGTVTVTGSTIDGNQATGTGDGGGVCDFGAMTVTNSTVTGNTSTGGEGGGIDADGGLTLVYATVTHNSAVVGANLGFSTLASFASVVALPSGGAGNCGTAGMSNGFNFTDDASCGFTAAETHPGVDPALGPLAANGGPTRTELPQSGSPLIDAVPVAHCRDDGASTVNPLVDQRGVARPQGAACDIGAVEVQAVAPVVIVPRFTG